MPGLSGPDAPSPSLAALAYPSPPEGGEGVRYLARADGIRLAWRFRPGGGPTIVFLPGYMSDMTGGKASALEAWAAHAGRALLLFDYSGCGASEGDAADGTIDIWRDDALHLIGALTTGPLLLVGSSMGGWLAVLVALVLPGRVAGVIGIAAAPDFTDWGFTPAQRAVLTRDGQLVEPSEYGRDTVTSHGFWASGQRNLLLGGPIDYDGPVRLLQGQDDRVVPWQTALRLAAALRSADVQVTLIKDGDHRLSRDADLALLIATVARFPELP